MLVLRYGTLFLVAIGGSALGDQAQDFKQHLFADLRCIGRSIVLGGDLNQVATHEFQAAQSPEKLG